MTAPDIAIVWDAERSAGDWQITAAGDLLTAESLETAVMVSLFTDARAQPDDRMQPGDGDRRGWWGNAIGNDPIGSRLWLLRRAARRPDTLRLAEDYIREALAWFLTDGLAATVTVSAEWVARSRIGARIEIAQGEGRVAVLRAEWAWQGI